MIREACARHDGVEVDTQGDAFFFAFPTAPGALAAASAFTEVLSSGAIRVRVGLHTGTPLLTEEGYVGGDVHRAARIAACGHGGQVLVSSSTAQLVELELADLGEHRLKDLSAPERVFQLGDREFPTLKSLYRTNLPVPATPFLGRERELAEVLALLAEDGVRLLTLTGPGGTGKTRLALQAAGGSADRYPDGVYWVPLAPLRDPALVLGEASQALAAQDGLAAHIADKELLLLFDNFEHVVEAAPGLAELLSACPNLSLLVTSRELLALPGEQAYPVPPLAEEDGSELFLARARAADPGFRASSAVGELCAELEQLPLALELAAARVRVLTPEKLLERLSGRLDLLKAGRGVDPRQQTLRATIEWSYELLSEEERQLFARLACFRGGCTLDAAEEICRGQPRPAAIARRQEPPALQRGPLLDAGDDPRVRGRAAGGVGRVGRAATTARGVVRGSGGNSGAAAAERHRAEGVAGEARPRARQRPRRARLARGLGRGRARAAPRRSVLELLEPPGPLRRGGSQTRACPRCGRASNCRAGQGAPRIGRSLV